MSISDLSRGKTIKAKSGEMLKSENDQFLLLKLNVGSIYEKLPIGQFKDDRYPYQKTFFDEAIIKFDLSGFKMQQSNEDLFKRDFEMLNFIQLDQTIDSLDIVYQQGRKDFSKAMINKMVIYNEYLIPPDSMNIDSNQLANMPVMEEVDTIININNLHHTEVQAALLAAQAEMRTRKEVVLGQINYQDSQKFTMTQFVTALHQRFTLSFAVIVLFFVGAPLGAIIKKGGLGAPLVFATLFFLLYYILTIMGENMVESGFLTPWRGMWMSTLILTPLGIFLTYKAANDSALFDRDVYKRYFRRTFLKDKKLQFYLLSQSEPVEGQQIK